MPPRHRPLQSSCREPTARFAQPRAQAAALKVSGAPRRRERGPCCDAATMCSTPLANPVTHANDVMTECGRAPTPLANTCTPDPPWRTLSRGSMRRWRICWFTVGLPSTAFTLHVAVTWNARSVRMRPLGSPNNVRQYWFQRARNVPGGNEVLVLLTKWIGSRLRFGCGRLSSFSSAPHGRGASALCAKEAVA